MIKKRVCKLYYSGEKSRTFWDKINSIKDDRVAEHVHSLAILLQNLEELVIGELKWANRTKKFTCPNSSTQK